MDVTIIKEIFLARIICATCEIVRIKYVLALSTMTHYCAGTFGYSSTYVCK